MGDRIGLKGTDVLLALAPGISSVLSELKYLGIPLPFFLLFPLPSSPWNDSSAFILIRDLSDISVLVLAGAGCGLV